MKKVIITAIIVSAGAAASSGVKLTQKQFKSQPVIVSSNVNNAKEIAFAD